MKIGKSFEDTLSELIASRIQELNEAELSAPLADEKRAYTITELQDILGISRVTAYEFVKKNLFHSVRIGSSIRISKCSFDAWLDKSGKES